MFFDDWSALGRTAIVGVLAYLALVLLLRVSGKRTLSKMNAFDFVVTVALGSTLATVLLSSTVSLTRGVLAFAVLIFLQFAITWLSARSGMVHRLVKSEPTLLFFRGEFLLGAMKRERVTEDEIRAALRAEGVAAMEDVEAVVLETESSFSVVKKPVRGPHSTLDDVVNRSTRDPRPDNGAEPTTHDRTSGGAPGQGSGPFDSCGENQGGGVRFRRLGTPTK